MPQTHHDILPFRRRQLADEQVQGLEQHCNAAANHAHLFIWDTIWQVNPDFLPSDEQEAKLPGPFSTVAQLARLIIPTSCEYHRLAIPDVLEAAGVLAIGSLLLKRPDLDIAASRLVTKLNVTLASVRSPYRL